MMQQADYVKLWLFCLAAPALYALAITYLNVPIGSSAYQTGAQAQIGIDWIHDWLMPDGGDHATGDISNFDRFLPARFLPVYPIFLTVIVRLFGPNSMAMVLVIQTIIAAGTIYLTAQSARELRQGWTWPAAVLAALTINIAYRGTLVDPEVLLTFLVAAFVFCSLKALSSERVLAWLLALGLVGSVAILTHPVFQFVLLLALPVYLVALATYRGITYRRAATMILIPVTFMVAAYGSQVMKVRALTGHATFTTQAGNAALFWLMPCLAQPHGCGHRSPEKMAEAQARLTERLASVDPRERQNPVIIDRHSRALAVEMLLELPLLDTAVAAAASMAKLMLHSGIYEIYDRAGFQSVHLTGISASTLLERIKNFSAIVFGSVPMLIWLLSQIALIVSRGLEIAGSFSGISDKALRWKTLFLGAIVIALLAPAVGLGNPRYRTPAEPVLILLLLKGLHMVCSTVSGLMTRRKGANLVSH